MQEVYRMDLMCNSLWSNQAIQVKWRATIDQIKKDTNSVRQYFTNQTMLKMPKVVYTDLVYFETSCQV